jgi:hypothetical protein
MDADKNSTSQLPDPLEELLIENAAYRSALTNLENSLPTHVQRLAVQRIENAKADRKL